MFTYIQYVTYIMLPAKYIIQGFYSTRSHSIQCRIKFVYVLYKIIDISWFILFISWRWSGCASCPGPVPPHPRHAAAMSRTRFLYKKLKFVFSLVYYQSYLKNKLRKRVVCNSTLKSERSCRFKLYTPCGRREKYCVLHITDVMGRRHASR